jgi:F0F1-type ATP synthase epsilon subunit
VPAVEHFKLEIISPTQTKIVSVLWVEVEGENGSFVVGAHHSPLISLLKRNGTLRYRTSQDDDHKLLVSGGTFFVMNNSAHIILNS